MSSSSDKLSPAMRQHAEAKAAHPDAILFFRMGDFYELFFDDAVLASRELDLMLTSRSKETNPIPMAGVPYHAADGYIRRLIAKGYHVAICDQLEDPAGAKGVVKRGVTRIITPGLMTDDQALEAGAHNYLVSLSISSFREADVVAIAALDISTGDLRLLEVSGLDAAATEVRRIGPAQLLVAAPHATLFAGIVAAAGCDCTVRPELPPRLDKWLDGIGRRRLAWDSRTAQPHTLSGPELRERFASLAQASLADRAAVEAARVTLLDYLPETQGGIPANLDAPTLHRSEDFAVLDPASLANLEVFETLMGGRKQGSLVRVIDQTVTAAGARRLRTWLSYPLTRIDSIMERQRMVTALVEASVIRDRVREQLRACVDIHRVSAKLAAAQGGPRDLVSLRRSLEAIPGLRAAMGEGEPHLARFAASIDDCADLAAAIGASLLDEPALSVAEGPIIRPGFSDDLDEIHRLTTDGRSWMLQYEAVERTRTGITSLKVRYNRVFGYYIEITNANREAVPVDYLRKQTVANAERYITPELKEYEEKLLTADSRRIDLETRLLGELRDTLVAKLPRLKRSADLLADLDVLAGLAELSHLRRYCPPLLTADPGIDIHEGRHPVVETMVEGERFVPNATRLSQEDRIIILTGPNMAGKSTVIRQVALIVLLAQIGSHVPAASATIGIVDQIFSRVGASDNLAKGQSTFMVEMSETAHILRSATARSLVVLDEIGRGTATYDGISIAWAVAEYLHDSVGAMALFATHYHELTELVTSRPAIRNCSVAVRDTGNEVVFLRRVVDGAANRSFGIAVARMAGLPEPVVARARHLLQGFESDGDGSASGPILRRGKRAQAHSGQVSLFDAMPPEPTPTVHPALLELQALALDTLSPLEALQTLYALQKQSRGRG